MAPRPYLCPRQSPHRVCRRKRYLSGSKLEVTLLFLRPDWYWFLRSAPMPLQRATSLIPLPLRLGLRSQPPLGSVADDLRNPRYQATQGRTCPTGARRTGLQRMFLRPLSKPTVWHFTGETVSAGRRERERELVNLCTLHWGRP